MVSVKKMKEIKKINNLINLNKWSNYQLIQMNKSDNKTI
jgi:hypothetical protein